MDSPRPRAAAHAAPCRAVAAMDAARHSTIPSLAGPHLIALIGAVVQPLPQAAAARWRRLPERSAPPPGRFRTVDAATRWARYWPWARNNGAARFLGPGRLYETRYPDPMANNRDDGTRSWDAKARWQMGSLHAPLQPLLGPNVTFDRAVGLHTHPITAPKPFFFSAPPWPAARPLCRCAAPCALARPPLQEGALPKAHGSLRRCTPQPVLRCRRCRLHSRRLWPPGI